MKNLLKITGIAIALATIGVAVRVKGNKNYIPSQENLCAGGNVKIGPHGIKTEAQQY